MLHNRLRGLLYHKSGRGMRVKIAAPQADDFLLASLYAYPHELSGFAESLGNLKHFTDLHEMALFNGWLDAVLDGKNLPEPETEKDLMQQIKQIRLTKSAEIVSEEVAQYIYDLQLNQLKDEFAEKQKEYLRTENPEIKAQIDALQQEIENFASQHEE